jgi:hypothetical protein
MKLHVLIVVSFVLNLQGFINALAFGAEQNNPGVPVTRSSVVTASSGGMESGNWSFVVFGDTRDTTSNTKKGISPLLDRLVEGIVAEKPALVIHIGDLINGFYTSKDSPVHKKYSQMFENWKTAVKPIYDFNGGTGIPLYVVRGNHEDGELVTNEDLKAAYLKSIAPLMPQNGPKQEMGLTYSVQYKQATFIAVDEYSIKGLGLLRGHVDLPWLKEQLSRIDRIKNPFIFVFGHVPAYKVAPLTKAPPPNLYDFPRHRDVFWKSLQDAGVSMYFCGHFHFYCRVTKDNIQQVLIGNGGANTSSFSPNEVDPSVTLNYPTAFMKASDVKTGYVLFTVNEVARTITAVQKLWNESTDKWESGDAFTVHVQIR